MKDKLLKAINDFNLISPGDSVLVGFSGGADSLCLLHLLNSLKYDLSITVFAAHVNHCLRGSEADSDESFVIEFCKNNGIKLYTKRININLLCEQNGKSTELCARDERYKFFNSLGFSKIATAHTGSDCIETMLMNLSRGSSLHGLCSIPPKRDNIIRPLIYFTRTDTENYCKDNNLLYVTDSTNLTDDYTRNKFRHSVLGTLTIINPSFEVNAMRCISLLREDDSYILQAAKNIYNNCICCENKHMLLLPLFNQPSAIIRRCISLFLSDNTNSDYEMKHIVLIEKSLGQNFSVTLPFGVQINGTSTEIYVKENDVNKITKYEDIIFSKYDGYNGLFGQHNIYVTVSDNIKHLKKNECAVDFFKINDIIKIRSRAQGDKITLKSRKCTKSVKKLFNELKIPTDERSSIPVLSDENGIICILGVGVDASREISLNTSKYLIIKSEGDSIAK